MDKLGTDDLEFIMVEDEEIIIQIIEKLINAKNINLHKHFDQISALYVAVIIMYTSINEVLTDKNDGVNIKNFLCKINYKSNYFLPLQLFAYNQKRVLSLLNYNTYISENDFNNVKNPTQAACAGTATHPESMRNRLTT